MRLKSKIIWAAAASLLLSASALRAETCSPDSFAEAVDGAAGGLRRFNGEAQPKLQEKMKVLAARKGWDEKSYEEKAFDYLQDGRINELNAQSNELLGKIDTLGRPADAAGQDCSKLAELKAAGVELLSVMRVKFEYMSEKLDLELGVKRDEVAKADPPAMKPAAASPPKAQEPAPAAKAPEPAQPKPSQTSLPPSGDKGTGRDAPANPPLPPVKQSWETKSAAAPLPPPAAAPPAQPGDAYSPPPVEFTPDTEGYTIDEIREASRGFFGTISTSLGSVIEHAFSEAGRPTAYVLGTEGGGAFLAGLRYGEGTLYLRSGGTRKVYWHGPSVGYDLGADGGRTLVLIYRMREPERLYRMFTGVDGSAYLVGGVGMTLLKGGDVIMAPIRSGLGLRLGANIGYIRFTDRPTWNPF